MKEANYTYLHEIRLMPSILSRSALAISIDNSALCQPWQFPFLQTYSVCPVSHSPPTIVPSTLTADMRPYYHQDSPDLVTVDPGVQVTSDLAILMATAMALGMCASLSLISPTNAFYRGLFL